MGALYRIGVAGLIAASILGAAGPVAAQDQASSEAAATSSKGQSYPARYVRMITGSAGSMVDIVGRQLGQQLGERWGQSVVVENRGGAGLTIGTGLAARASPDGYTILLSDRTAIAVAPHLHKALAYDPQRDLVPISLVALAPSLLVAHPSVPSANLREFLDYAKQLKGSLDFATAGVGTGSHISGELFRHATAIKVVSVHYKGGGAAVLGILSGETKAGFTAVPVSLPHVRAGKLKAFAISSRNRFAGTPEIPTVAEAGGPEFETQYWIGMFAPARTPAALIATLNRDLVGTLEAPAVNSMLVDQGAQPRPGTPEEFAAFIRSESANMKKVIELAGIRAE